LIIGIFLLNVSAYQFGFSTFVHADTNKENVFLPNVREFEYITIFEGEFEYITMNEWDIDYNYNGIKYSKRSKYEILNVDFEENYFNVKLTSTLSLISSYGMEVKRIAIKSGSYEVEQFPFSNERDFEIVVDRKIDLTTGKVISFLSDSFEDKEIFLVCMIDAKEEESSWFLSSFSIGVIPFPWQFVFQQVNYSSWDTMNITTNSGVFNCYPVKHDNGVAYFDTETNLRIQFLSNYTVGRQNATSISTLSKIVRDRIKIVKGGASSAKSNVNKIETVWFQAAYDYDSEIFDESKGSLYVNNESMTWSSKNNRWEKEFTVENPQKVQYRITNVQDEMFGLTLISDEVGPVAIEWVSQGIPGFPLVSVMVGVLIWIIMLRLRHN